ncbi:MAG: MYXO-CTERM sorting domain-containing protein [Myxococcota bacterium]
MAIAARIALAAPLVGLLALPGLAAANPAVEACAGKAEGASCGVMKLVKPADGGELQRTTVPGACRPDECCDLDYSKGSPPETVCHACLACKEGPADLTAKPSDPGPSSEPPRAEGGPPAPAPAEQRGCTIGGATTPVLGAWLLMLGIAGLGRRRRQPQ